MPGTTENAAKALEGEAPEGEKPMPEVPPPDFINCCKAVLLNFGNLDMGQDRGDLSVQIKVIASEAEVVATRIYGKSMSPREQQVRAQRRGVPGVWAVGAGRGTTPEQTEPTARSSALTHRAPARLLFLFSAVQDRAWKEQTTSIFDLETLEIEAERRGETAPWANPDGGDELIPGFNKDGKMQVGGS